MPATFVFELNGIRWVVDPGNQNYYLLNRIGFRLSDESQNGDRWKLLTKKNQGHSTVTVNDDRFLVNHTATISDFKSGPIPEATIDLTPVYGKNINNLKRRFVKESDKSILIDDRFEISDSTQNITWGLMTLAEVNEEPQGSNTEAGWQNTKNDDSGAGRNEDLGYFAGFRHRWKLTRPSGD